jgi:hypothetical protein
MRTGGMTTCSGILFRQIFYGEYALYLTGSDVARRSAILLTLLTIYVTVDHPP